jgi:hypothetical protein
LRYCVTSVGTAIGLMIRTSERPRFQAQTGDMLGVAPRAHVCTAQSLEPAQTLTITLMYILQHQLTFRLCTKLTLVIGWVCTHFLTGFLGVE